MTITYNWYDVVEAGHLLLQEVYLIKFCVAFLTQINYDVLWRFYKFLIEFRDIIRRNTRHLLTLSYCAHDVGFAIIRINLHFFVWIQELQIVNVLVGRRNFLLCLHVCVHVPPNFRLRNTISFVWKIEAKIWVNYVARHFEVASQALIGCILLGKDANATDSHFSNCHVVFPLFRHLGTHEVRTLLANRAGLLATIGSWTLLRGQLHIVGLRLVENFIADIFVVRPLSFSISLGVVPRGLQVVPGTTVRVVHLVVDV